ncbi:predicted protein [Postia placenta Mad-698-R]|nr:predicted protein [Postia placenta Mad-698-R]
MDAVTRRLLVLASLGVRLLKYTACLVFLVNLRSWPLSWHFRVFSPLIALRLRLHLLRLRLLFKPRHVKQRAKAQWLAALSPVGKSPFDVTVAWKGWASPDDCDYNLHLSNSCYAKSLDSARLAHVLKCFPTFFRAGGWMPLGGTHYTFLREIPILARYEIRVRIVSWDNKWLFLVAHYVTKSKPSKTQKRATKQPAAEHRLPPTPPEHDARAQQAPVPLLHTPATPLLLTSGTPEDAATPVRATPDAKPDAHAVAVAAALRMHADPDDDVTLHCVAVSEVCFKVGRITVPPALVLTCDGMCDARAAAAGSGSSDGAGGEGDDAAAGEGFSHARPPPFWAEVKRLRGSELELGGLRAFYEVGAPEDGGEDGGARWWEAALGGEVEARRRAGMAVVGALKTGMDGMEVGARGK